MGRKALFFDVDGTLLTDDGKRLPESAEKAIKAARQAGHLVFINSGRTRCFLRELEERLAVDGWLCGCGTYIEARGERLLHHLIEEGRRRELQDSILKHRLDGILEGTDGCYVQEGISRMIGVESVKSLYLASGVVHAVNWEKSTVPFDKFCVLADEESDIAGFLASLEPDIVPVDRGRGLFECVPAGFDKATAMEMVLDYYGIPWEESYAFGDSTNDLAMIRYACHSIIMGKHHESLEPYASFITKNVEDDGIAWAFEKLHII